MSKTLPFLLCLLCVTTRLPVLSAADEPEAPATQPHLDATARPEPVEGSRCNILLILADDVGREAIGAWGGQSYATPEIDKLAEGGMKFEHFYTATVCHPTRVTIMSGRYPWKTGNEKWGWYNPDHEKETIAHVLKAQGYATAIAGKWQLMLMKNDPQQPHRMGFDEYSLFGWHEGPRFWAPLLWENGELHDHPVDTYGPDFYTDFLIQFMAKFSPQAKNRAEGASASAATHFFAYYPMALCHAVADDFMPRPSYGPGRDTYENFGEMVAEMDRQVGKLVNALDELGLRENTLILFTTDNGSPKNVYVKVKPDGKKFDSEPTVSKWKGRGNPELHEIPGQKGEFADWGTRAPTIANWPGTIEPGSSTDALIDLSDLLPTLAEIAGAQTPTFPLDGTSFAPLLTGGTQANPRAWVCTPAKKNHFAVRTRNWKLINNGNLFDMKGDPVVEKTIAPENDTPESAAARTRLQAYLDELKTN